MPSRDRVNWAKLRIFAVAVAAMAILSTLAYLLTGGTLLERKATLYLYVSDATGLSQESPVRVDGIGVGTVDSVALSGDSRSNRVVRATLKIERVKLTSIPVDSYAELSTETLIGDKFVDITSGRAAESIAPGAELTFKAGGMMKSLDLTQFQKALRQVDALLTDIEQGRGRVGEFVAGEGVYNALEKRVGQIEQDIRKYTAPNTIVGQALYTDTLYRQISQPLLDLDRRLAEFQAGRGSLGPFLTDTAQYERIRSEIQNLTRTVADLRAGEFLQSDRDYTRWNQTVASLIRSVEDFNIDPMLASSEMYDNLNGSLRELRDTVRDFRENPKKYLRIVF
jgi:phospholipid/cholesterol/gamma-HCH transport system substrate-binding protein